MSIAGLPTGAVCATHIDTPATATCHRCGTFACNACSVFEVDGSILCTACATRRFQIPFERRRELGLAAAFWETAKLALLKPRELFRATPADMGFASPLLFAVIAQGIGACFAAVWAFALALVTSGGSFVGAGEATIAQLVMAVLSPFLTIVGLFIGAGFVHVALMIFGAARGPYDTTLRVLAYCGATSLFGVVPFIGTVIAAFWGLAIQIVGLSTAHGSSQGRVAAALLVPIGVCICLAASAFGVAIATMGSGW